MRLERHAVMNGYYFPVESYGSLREYFEKLRQSDEEIVVLHQVESVRLIKVSQFALIITLANN